MGRRVLLLIFVSALVAMPGRSFALKHFGDQGASGQYQNEDMIEELTEQATLAPDQELNIKYGGDHEGVVTEVVDSARVKIDGQTRELIGVRAPGSDDCFAHESRDYVESKILGKKVSYSEEQLKGHKRWLGDQRIYLYVGHSLLNSEIIRKGMGFADRRPAYPEEESFAELQVEARRRHMGLWHTCPVECDRFGDCETRVW